jgi:hypothetical protein
MAASVQRHHADIELHRQPAEQSRGADRENDGGHAPLLMPLGSAGIEATARCMFHSIFLSGHGAV